MGHLNRPKATNFKPRPQNRKMGSGVGRVCRPWKRKWPWLVITAERVCVIQSGSEGGILEERRLVEYHKIKPDWLRSKLEYLYPGITEYIERTPGGPNPWDDLQNRVYKMYYNGTSARGKNHDPNSRASISREHWRSWTVAPIWDEEIAQIVENDFPVTDWRKWVS